MAEASSVVDKVKARLQALRERYQFVDHLILMNEHYGKVQGSVLAGAVTYFGFLSFFPVLALAFAVVGYISVYYPDAKDALTTAIEQILPGIVSTSGKPGTISLADIEGSKEAATVLGFLGVLYSGLGWLSGLRTALQNTFQVPQYRQGNFVVGKLTDLVVLGILGLVMIVSVGVSGAVTGFATTVLGWVSLDGSPLGKPLIWGLGLVLGLAASTFLFFVMYKMLGKPRLPPTPLLQGAFLGAFAFELLKLVAVNILGGAAGSAVAALAIAVTLVVWINYFSRLVLYGASWAMTSSLAGDSTMTRRADLSEAAVAVADRADARARLPVAVRAAPVDEGQGARFDTGSAVVGAVAGFVTALIVGRSR
ncbi:MAG: YihY/virulence factor BrkB family protein [Propionibacteriales bacterium]|nr:YihY/virulence factor BrkB family protein [Propionibacteriales bacterium]